MGGDSASHPHPAHSSELPPRTLLLPPLGALSLA
uniref:Uncharacterized protein n=1 Tax=Anguilla anguilla TaxID=7936 RepID=A0A0E9SYL3_ANGAN